MTDSGSAAGALYASLAAQVRAGGVVVVPTEVGARYWQRRLLLGEGESGAGAGSAAMWTDSVVSWDRFIEGLRSSERGARMPIDDPLRVLFAHVFMQENNEKKYLKKIIPQDMEPGSAIGLERITALLPYVQRMHAQVAENDYFHDLQVLYEHYDAFLRRHNLVEESGNNVSPDDGSGQGDAGRGAPRELFVYPELYSDARYYQHFFTDTRRCIPVPGQFGKTNRTLYRSIYDEVEDTALKIVTLLQGGSVAAEDIVVTAVNLADISDIIGSTFQRYAIPHAVHQTRRLTDSTCGRLISGLHRGLVHNQPFSLCRELLEDPQIPWSETVRGERQVYRALQEHRLYRAFGARISGLLHALGGAGSFAELHGELQRALYVLIDPEGWTYEQQRELQFIMHTLTTLVDYEQRYGISVSNPFGLYLYVLEHSGYRAGGQKPYGVSVYPYPLVVGVMPPCHFVINLSRKIMRKDRELSEVLPEMMLDQLGVGEEGAGTAGAGGGASGECMVRAHSHSGGRVWFSANQSASAGGVPPALLFSDCQPQESSEAREHDYYLRESAAWAGGRRRGNAKPPGAREADNAVLPYQRDGAGARKLLHALKFAPRRDDAVRTLPGPVTDRDSLTFRHISAYLNCPLGLYFDLLLPRRLDFDLEVDNNLGIGVVEHAVLAEILGRRIDTELQAAGGDDAPLLQEVGETLDAHINKLAIYQQPFYSEGLKKEIAAVIEYLQQDFSGYKIAAVEKTFSVDTGKTWKYNGRVDLLLQRPDGESYAIIDFKRSEHSVPKKEARDLQLTYYCELAQGNGYPTGEAYYVTTKNIGKIPKKRAEAQGIAAEDQAMRTNLRAAMRECVEAIDSGDFRLRGGSEDGSGGGGGCPGCQHLALCRVKLRGHEL